MNVRIPEKWGLCFEGNEQAFTECILATITEGWVYLEIGLGCCDTIRAVNAVVAQTGIKEWYLHGVDVPGYRARMMPKNFILHDVGSEAFCKDVQVNPDMVFIDACHCQFCCQREFKAIENRVTPGGIVVFHDTCAPCQHHHDPQPCGGGIEVRQGLADLGLLDGTRPDWELINETYGQVPKSHGCMMFRRVG